MAQRRSPPTRHDDTHNRKYHLRRSPTSHRLLRLQSTPEQGPRRPVLVPLHTNLRRRPSRFQHSEKLQDDPMAHAQLGSKRKRVPSANENAHAGGRPTRGSGRLKRLRSDPYEASEGGEASGMDVDTPASTRWSASASDDELLSDLSSDEDGAETSTCPSTNRLIVVHMVLCSRRPFHQCRLCEGAPAPPQRLPCASLHRGRPLGRDRRSHENRHHRLHYRSPRRRRRPAALVPARCVIGRARERRR
ncbi:hypothetical protein B0H19DRAFT_589224 [Mycena capillaripes]|nr:hypothetical protein B0H19DRAFT_589224 [Mycena capillaripes]